jgi:hypothetical protein
MKYTQLILAAFFGGILTASAQLTIPSDGSDGALNITQDTVIDLSQAVTGTWDQNNSAKAGKGVYDPEKWAVVFKYSSVNIEGSTSGSPAQLVGRTVRFKNHPSNAPVVWLVQGNVNIAGRLLLVGQNDPGDSVSRLVPIESGPGGFRGGPLGPTGNGSGYGPGAVHGGGNGTYASSYGNPQIIPLIGGSGAGGGDGIRTIAGAGGGGAILIAASGIINVTGMIDASGGLIPNAYNLHGGSGGAIRLVAQNIIGSTNTSAGITANLRAFPNGRIRIEGNLSSSVVTTPESIGVPPANPPILWPAANAPKARVISVDALSAPSDPTSPLVAAADVAIQNNKPVNIVIETRDFPIEGVVQLAVIPKFSARSWLPATRISGDINVATWRVTTTLPQGFVTLQARATQP